MVVPLVGRELDLAVCLEQLKRVERGTTAALLVRGDGGIGKSRLVAELAARARQLGHPVLIGRADDLDHGIPYAVFRDLLARRDGDDDLGAVAASVEELRRSFDTAASGDAGEQEPTELSAVFAAAVRLCRALADRGPTVVVLEDLHVADRDSLDLAALLARLADVPMLMVVTLRTGAAADIERLLEVMADDGRAAVIDVEPLDRHDTHALVAGVLGAAPDDELGAAIFAASHGNPFFAQEVARSFAEGGAAVVDDGRARWVGDAAAAALRPTGALLRRLFGGTSLDVELAKVMSVFGRFSLRHLPLVERLLAQPAENVTRSFDRLVKAGLLVASAAGGYEFSHSIVRATLYEDIGPAERRRIHAAIAAELATERRAGMVLDVLELATHVAESAEPGDEAAAAVLLEAGRAIAATAPLVSAGYLRRAADLLPAPSLSRAVALAAQTRALHLGSRPAEAARVGRTALAALAEQPDAERRLATAALVVNDLYLCGAVHDALEVLDTELADGGAACPLLAIRVNLLMQAGRYAEAAEQFEAARAAVGGSPASELMAIAHLVQYANHVGRVEAAGELLDRLDGLALGASTTIQLAVHELAPFADWRPGIVARIERHLEAARRLRPDAAALSIGGTFEASFARLLWMRGDWDQALELIRRASFDLEQRGATTSAHLLLCTGCELLVDRGTLDEAATAAGRLVTPIQTLVRYAALVRGRIHAALGELSAAEQVLVAERDAARVEGASYWKLAELLTELAPVQVGLGRTDDAAETVDELDELARRTGWLECQVAALRTRAVVRGDADAAGELAALAETEGWEVERAHAALLLGELDVDPARHLVDAYRRFDAYGAAPWRRRAAAGLRTRGLTVPRRATEPRAGLTETEVQLVRLVRDGRSNRQIAAAMHYSMKTIEVYLSRVYAKTACASRLELIRAVDRGDVEV